MKKTATAIKLVAPTQLLFKVSPSIKYNVYVGSNEYQHRTFYVVSSKATYSTGKETYLFPSDEQGKVISWTELEGSEKGIHNFAKPLENMNYETKIPKAFRILYETQI